MSKELDILNEIRFAPSFMGGNDRYRLTLGSDTLYNQDCDIIEKALKALDVLKKILKWENGKWNMNLYDATKEERELLKEVLGNGKLWERY